MIPHSALARILYRLFPLHDDPRFADRSLEDLKRSYRKWDVFCIIAFLVLAVAASYALHELFVAYVESRPRPPAVHELRPGTVFWWAPAGILGCVVAGLLIRLIYPLLLGQRTAEYRY